MKMMRWVNFFLCHISTILVPYVGGMNIPATPAKNQGQGFDQIRDDVPDVGYNVRSNWEHRYLKCPRNDGWYNVRPPFTIAKLVNITPITMVYGTQITIVTGAYKPTYNWASHGRKN